jgi:uncharacterized protein
MNTVDNYIDGLPEDTKAIVVQLRSIIHTLVPAVQEKFSFKIPFYHYFGMFCYINPLKDGIDLGICNGKSFADDFEHLEVKGRTLIATVRLHSLNDILLKQVAEILATAAINKEVLADGKKKNIENRACFTINKSHIA